MKHQQNRIVLSVLLLAAAAAVVVYTLFPDIFLTDRFASSQRESAETLMAAGCQLDTDDSGRVISVKAHGLEFTNALAARLQELPDLRQVQAPKSVLQDETLRILGSLSNLETLHLSSTAVTAGGLAHLTQLTKLRELVLGDCRIDDSDTEWIAQIGSLRTLNLDRTDVTDEGLKVLAALQNLEKLYLGGTQIQGTGFARFTGHDGLLYLALPDTPLTEEGLSSLKNLGRLQQLYLDGVKFTAPLLQKLMDVAIESFPDLRVLFLSRTPLTDESVDTLTALAEMPELSLVSIHDTGISHQAFFRLEDSTPDIRYMVSYPASNEPNASD